MFHISSPPGRHVPACRPARAGTHPRRLRPPRGLLLLLATLAHAATLATSRGDEQSAAACVPAATVRCGDLAVDFLDNARSPEMLSGIDRLFNQKSAAEFDAFDPYEPSSSAGLNFEHIISGHHEPANWFAPRHGRYRLERLPDPHAVVLVRKHSDDPWLLESSTTYRVTAPHYIDFEFCCRPHDASRFGDRRWAVLFWANYMNDVQDVSLHFRGIPRSGAEETWIAADAPTGDPEYFGGGTYRHIEAPPLSYDADHNLKLNLWSYDYPRFSQPFYYGRAAHDMVFMLMFDRAYSADDQVRFSLFKFKVGEQVRRPAWDFQYLIHRVETGRFYGFRGRLVWKKFVSPEDCRQEYEQWKAALSADWQPKLHPSAEMTDTDGDSPTSGAVRPERGWQLPPTAPVTRATPPLLNYFHMDFREGRVDRQEARLAQWNLLVLNHDLVVQRQLSLARIREINPTIKLLAWVPLQGPHNGLEPGVPPPSKDDWYARRADGSPIVPHWGGRLMNVYTQDFAWPKHVLDYVNRECLTPEGYDGLMLDCLWEFEPDQQDVNRDGTHDQRDTEAWQAGMMFLLRSLRERYPDTLLVGNGGGPWSDTCPYYELANGCMHENALGDQFGGGWQQLWEGYQRTLAKVKQRAALHLIAADVRAGRRSQLSAAWLWRLAPDDLRRARLGLATSLLLDGGYFGFDRGDCLHGQLWWLREYDVNLGNPVRHFEANRYGEGTFSRAFSHGLVIVNPTARALTATLDAPLFDAATGVVSRQVIVPPEDACLLVGNAAP